MKISYKWLKELIDFDLSPEEVAELLTMSGSEVEAIEIKGEKVAGVITAHVSSVEPHPNADRLTVCEVSTGSENIKVVCGAPNVKPGMKVLFAPIGAVLTDGTKLKKTKIRDIESHGMILAEDEIGISDDHTGIIVLDDSVEPGYKLSEILDITDYIYELEITPNRPDCLSHLGIARELKALTGKAIKYPDFGVNENNIETSKKLTIEIDDPEGCPRYTGRLVQGIKVAPSPIWLKQRLFYLGMRPINNVVDVTNYIMMETGQPLHAFDYRMIPTDKIVVKRAVDGEKFTTLDDIERKLDSDHLMITDGDKAVAIAGIMGGQNSEVTDDADDILLESAFFNPVVVRRGAKKLNLSTESSQRFERGADIEMASRANNRACRLIAEFAGGEICKGIVDCYPNKFVPVKIDFRPERANALLGCSIETGRMKQIFSGLDIKFSENGKLSIEQPSFRPDLTREVDLIEEIARIYGLDNIEASIRPGGKLEKNLDTATLTRNQIRSFLVGRSFCETFGITLVDGRQLEKINITEKLVKLQNPLSEEMSVLRPDLAISMLKTLRHNINYSNRDIKIFELGTRYLQSDGELADEKEMLCLGLSGRENSVSWRVPEKFVDFYTLRSELENLLGFCKIEFVLKAAESFYYDEKCSFDIYTLDDIRIGSAGQVSKAVLKAFGVKQDSFITELDFAGLVRHFNTEKHYKQLPKFPSSDRDIALIVDNNVLTQDILDQVHNVAGKLIDDCFVFDLYRGKNIPDGKKSIAIRVVYRSDDKTLTDGEVDSQHEKVIKRITEKFDATLRA